MDIYWQRNGKLEKKFLKMGGPSVAQIKISPDKKERNSSPGGADYRYFSLCENWKKLPIGDEDCETHGIQKDKL